MGGIAADRITNIKKVAIDALPIEEKDKLELVRMEVGFLVMHCVAATAASRWLVILLRLCRVPGVFSS